jgi:tRNA dimethylallyltransferase
LHAELMRRAPSSVVDSGDRSRIVRYLELLESGEDPEPVAGQSQLWTADTRHPTVLAGLVMDRDALYAQIDRRMEAIAAAAGDEVRRADAAGASHTARKALGFEELLRGDVEAMKQKARRLARRQLTWMRKLANVETIDVTARSEADVAREIAARLHAAT